MWLKDDREMTRVCELLKESVYLSGEYDVSEFRFDVENLLYYVLDNVVEYDIHVCNHY